MNKITNFLLDCVCFVLATLAAIFEMAVEFYDWVTGEEDEPVDMPDSRKDKY